MLVRIMAFREDKTAYQAIFQHSSLGIIVSNAQGVIEQVNPHANKLFGYSNDELIGQKIEVLIPRKLKHQHESHRNSYNEKPRPRTMGLGIDLAALKKDGTEFPVEISLAHFETNGAKQIVSFINDITLRKKADEELKKLNSELEEKVEERTKELSQAIMELQHINDNLEKAMVHRKKAEEEALIAFEREKELSELKSRFVSMASHEFRTPLSGILTSVSLIARYTEPSDNEKRAKHIQTIKNSVHNLTSILNDFLSLDKLEEGRLECHPKLFSIEEFVENLTQEMEVLSKKGQKILYEHHGEHKIILLDPQLLRNILINLLSNAFKYSSENEKICLITTTQDSELRVVIKDNGIGIPMAEQKHLFERFFRARNATAIQGTGLGLTIVKKYLDLMGGSIKFNSIENAGTTFTITLPLEICP
jgi:PAS domain S-box-containing protein